MKIKVGESVEGRIARLEAAVEALQRQRGAGGDGPVPMKDVKDVVLEFGNDASIIREPTAKERYRDRSCVIVCPTRGKISWEVVQAHKNLTMPMNQRWNWMFACGYEVAAAYNALIRGIMDHKFLKTWTYVLTVEDDNIPPFDGVLRLMETLEAGPKGDGSSEWDAVGGLYFTKDSLHQPMLYGDGNEFIEKGTAHYFPVDLTKVQPCASWPCEDTMCLKHVVPVNGLAMGFTLWKMSLFRKMVDAKVEQLFMTVNDRILVDGELVKPVDADGMMELEPGKGYKKLCTQDLAFCDLAVTKFGARFAGDLRVPVGHLDTSTGKIY